ncbi:MAG TPA: phage portal protein [Clostridia bacterium]|nr:phage portal protein [Clostridia bacterium]
MKLFGFNISVHRPRAEAKPVTKSATEYGLGAMWPDATGAPVLSNAYQQVVWVYRAINALAEQVANIPFRFSTAAASGEKIINSGPLVEFYNRPHPQINKFQYWELRVIWLMLRGECFRVPVYDHAGRVSSVVLLDPARFQELIEDNELRGWRYVDHSRNTPLSSQVFLPEEVWHEKLPNPFDFWRGMPPLAVAATAAGTDYAAALHMRGIMENNGDAGLILRTSEQLDPEQREQLLAALRDRKRRAGTADRPVLLWGGAEVVAPKLSSSDMQFLANRKFSCTEICAAFGVPEEIITSTNAAKYDVMAGARLNFIENRVVPLCRRLEAEEEITIKSIDPKARGWFDVEDHPVLAQARRDRLEAAKTGFEMGVPFNELNRSFDLGFKPLPWGDKGYVPSAMTPANAPVQPAPTDNPKQ